MQYRPLPDWRVKRKIEEGNKKMIICTRHDISTINNKSFAEFLVLTAYFLYSYRNIVLYFGWLKSCVVALNWFLDNSSRLWENQRNRFRTPDYKHGHQELQHTQHACTWSGSPESKSHQVVFRRSAFNLVCISTLSFALTLSLLFCTLPDRALFLTLPLNLCFGFVCN